MVGFELLQSNDENRRRAMRSIEWYMTHLGIEDLDIIKSVAHGLAKKTNSYKLWWEQNNNPMYEDLDKIGTFDDLKKP